MCYNSFHSLLCSCSCQQIKLHFFTAHGDEWHEASVYIGLTVDRINIRAFAGDGDLGNIAIDDVTLTAGSCTPSAGERNSTGNNNYGMQCK